MKKLVCKIKESRMKKENSLQKINELYRTGLGYYRSHEYQNAYMFFNLAAEHNHKDAQYVLGIMYGRGRGVDQDIQQAVHWYKKSAVNGNLKSHHNLGVCYRDGIGVEKDEVKALYWFTLAAENGDVDSQYSTAIIYYKGSQQDHKMAYLWFKIAAENDHVMAQYALGLLHYYGHGVPQDLKKAFVWFERVSDKEASGDAYVYLGQIYLDQKDTEAAKQAYLKAALRGNSQAQYKLGQLYESIHSNQSEAIAWYKASASQGHCGAHVCLAQIYIRQGALDLAIQWFQKSHHAGNANEGTLLLEAQQLEEKLKTDNPCEKEGHIWSCKNTQLTSDHHSTLSDVTLSDE
ncbi:uncharacterized protein B0P05DRAFT_518736 [Gilbertella persicaria]|uniref:uncharacterized protein n=1 Tax=Gilbertella persicaria TaxID=101096 RepID=UPI00221EE9EE|nr:uncharacterized protein B0P05DRAFT_518736 [Gilbertella persicaria]KAI8051098.1 hypothetical protein B0P05DRAFT_518736 [Gilbertella persicaria]